MAPFKDEHLLIIVPGSRTTLAQVGLPESFTPARVRIKSRMFPTDTPGKYEPYRIRPKAKQAPHTNGDTTMADTTEAQPKTEDAAGEPVGDTDVQVAMPAGEPEEDDVTLEEDPMSDAGAIWPIQGGRIVDWPCFFALMQHLHNMLGGSFHTPVMLVAQPVWTPVEHIRITHFFFEKFRCPAFALMDAAQAMLYAYGVPSACVVDIGRDKADVSAIHEFNLSTQGRGIALPGLGGEAITQNLLTHMKAEGWDREMCEQLKLSPICEVLPAGVPIPGSKEAAAAQTNGKEKPSNPASAASTGADGSGSQQRNTAASQGEGPRGPGQDAEGRPGEVGEEDTEGVIDVASIVAGGKTSEYVAQKEKEKREKAAAAAARKKGGDADKAAQAKARLRNSEREFNSFVYDDKTARDRAKDVASVDDSITSTSDPVAVPPPTVAPPALTDSLNPPPLDTSLPPNPTTEQPSTSPIQTSPQTATGSSAPKIPSNPYARSLTAGPERFQALPDAYLPNLTLAIWTAIQSVPGAHARQALWDHILITGQGARVRGLKDAILAQLQARFLISPSSASIFTSEPPSSFGTPGGTGANSPLPTGQTPLPAYNPPPQAGGVNPLLYAATQNAGAAPPFRPGMPPATPQRGMTPGGTPLGQQYRGATPVGNIGAGLSSPALGLGGKTAGSSQTPTAVRTIKLPEYFGEWKEAGAEFDAAFLGAQVAAKVVFLADVQGGSNKGFMSRSDYNEQGPSAIADYSL